MERANRETAMNYEIERFKNEINLVDYASNKGFAIDKDESTKTCTIMRRDNDKIAISRDSDGHWICYDFRSERGGSIIDMSQDFRISKSLGIVRQELRLWIGDIKPFKLSLSHTAHYQYPVPASKDRQEVASEYVKTSLLDQSDYLEQRGIDQKTLTNERFHSTIRIDKHSNVCFTHRDHEGISGFEKKNYNFSAFSTSGERTLWFSKGYHTDKRIIICESGIDALSYFKLKDDGETQYCSIAGQLSTRQLELIDKVVGKNKGKKINLAFDNDKNGIEYAQKIKARNPDAKNLKVDLPEKTDLDWNDVLKDQIFSEKHFG